MVIRVVFAVALATLALPVAAQNAPPLPYDIANFYELPGSQTSVKPEEGPQIAYAGLEALLYNRVPDHIALGYRLEGLTGYVEPYRNGRDIDPLIYDFRNLVLQNRMELLNETLSAAGSP